MIVAAGLLSAILVIGFTAPRYLEVTAAPWIDPRRALTAWVASLTLVVAALLAIPFALALRPGRGMFGAAHTCIDSLRQRSAVPWWDVIELAFGAGIVLLLLHVAIKATQHLCRYKRWRDNHLRAIRLTADTAVQRDGIELLWVDAGSAVCYSVGGARHGAIVAGRGLIDLPAHEVTAILDHERAHLRGHHHLLLLLTKVLASSMPFLPLCRLAPDALRALLEFSADHAAARRSCPRTVGSALLHVYERGLAGAQGVASAPRNALAMSEEAVSARLRWLTTQPTRRQQLSSTIDYPFAITISLAPVLLAVVGIPLMVALACIRLGG